MENRGGRAARGPKSRRGRRQCEEKCAGWRGREKHERENRGRCSRSPSGGSLHPGAVPGRGASGHGDAYGRRRKGSGEDPAPAGNGDHRGGAAPVDQRGSLSLHPVSGDGGRGHHRAGRDQGGPRGGKCPADQPGPGQVPGRQPARLRPGHGPRCGCRAHAQGPGDDEAAQLQRRPDQPLSQCAHVLSDVRPLRLFCHRRGGQREPRALDALLQK